jgi:hypothetical protein
LGFAGLEVSERFDKWGHRVKKGAHVCREV